MYFSKDGLPIFFLFLLLYNYLKGCGVMIKNALLKRIALKEKIFILLFTFFFLFIQTIGYHCSKFDSAKLSSFSTYLFILLIPIFYFIFKVLFNLSYRYKNNKNIYKLCGKKIFLFSFLLILISWIPIIISFYPNNFSCDASTQVRMIIYDCISTYHPVVHTVFLGGLLKLSYLLFGTYTIGNFIYALIQALIMDLIFSYFVLFLAKEKAPRWLIILSMLLFMFLPTNSVLAITTTKDVIFSGLILLLVIKFYYISTHRDYLKEKKNLISTIIIMFLSLIFRNNMLYALILFFIPCIVILKRWKQVLMVFLIPLLLYGVYNESLTRVFHIEKGPKVEAFSVIIQQLARVYNKEKLTKGEASMIANLYKNDSLKHYNSQISDPVKSEFNSDVLFSNIGSYIKLYFKLGLKYPLTYMDSFLMTNYGYFYFFDKLPINETKTYIWVTCMNHDKDFSCKDDCNDNFIYHLYDNLLEKATYQKVPILNIFMNIGFHVFMMLFTICLLLYRKKQKFSLPIYLLLSLFVTNLLGPVSLMRYVYPIFVCLPFLLFIINKTWSEDKLD